MRKVVVFLLKAPFVLVGLVIGLPVLLIGGLANMVYDLTEEAIDATREFLNDMVRDIREWLESRRK